MNAAIAQHLNVSAAAVTRVEEWANVIFCVVKGLGARFVSKKVVKMADSHYTQSGDLYGRKLFVSADNQTAVLQGNGADAPFFNALRWTGEKWEGVEGWRSWSTFDAAVEHAEGRRSFDDKTPVIPAGYAVTSTGEVVLQADWDEIESAM